MSILYTLIMYIKKIFRKLVTQLKRPLLWVRLKYGLFLKIIKNKKYCLPFDKECIKKYTVKQIILIYFYKIKQLSLMQIDIFKKRIVSFLNSPFLYICILIIFLFFLHKLTLEISVRDLKELSYVFSGIIGSSIAIIFSFSLFSLQNSADLFSSQYLKRFIGNKKEKIFFWILVLLVTFILLLPYIITLHTLEVSILLFLVSFYCIYILFNDLKKRTNPEVTLKKYLKIQLVLFRKQKRDFKINLT